VTNAIRRSLRSSRVTARAVVEAIKAIQSGDPFTRDMLRQEHPFAEFVRVAETRILVAAFSIYRGPGAVPDSRPYMQFYAFDKGAWQIKAEVGNELRGCYWTILRAQPPAGNSIWYWFTGKGYGDTGSRLRAHLFGFDGEHVKRLWGRDGVVRGEFALGVNSFRIEHDVCSPGSNRDCKHVLDMWSISPEGRIRRRQRTKLE